MKSMLLALGAASLAIQPQSVPLPTEARALKDLPSDAKDHQPLLLGPTRASAILAHRAIFRDNLAKVNLTPALRARWKAIRTPLSLVAVFGSWCGDSQAQLPDLLALAGEANPFIEVHYLGVGRDKHIPEAQWPEGCAPQQVMRVPTFYLFATQPGGAQKRVGLVVENPPRAGQTMAEALMEMIEAAVLHP